MYPHNKVLSEKDVQIIRERYFGGIEKIKESEIELKNLRKHAVQANIARDYNVSAPHINRILKNKSRINVKSKITPRPIKFHSHYSTNDEIKAYIKRNKLEASCKNTKRNREIAAANKVRIGHKLPYNNQSQEPNTKKNEIKNTVIKYVDN